MNIIDELITIGNWAKSCKTKEQLMLVKRFLDKKATSPHTKFPKHLAVKVHYNLGIVDGIILTLSKTRFGESK